MTTTRENENNSAKPKHEKRTIFSRSRSKNPASGRGEVKRSYPILRSSIIAGALLLLPLTAPAGGVVTNCDEVSLRNAMTGGGTVTFACDGTIYLSSTISNTLDTVLDGNGHQITISGSNTVRLFYVATNVSFGATSVILADGFSPEGSAILNLGGNVNLAGVTLRSNVASTAAVFDGLMPGAGGAILNQGGVVNATNCSFSENLAYGRLDSPGAGGGAILNQSGRIFLERCAFRGNRALGGTALHVQTGGTPAAGGAIHNRGELTLHLCMLAGNSATGGYGQPPDWMSGGMGGKASGGAVFNAGTFAAEGSTICSNSASGGRGGLGYTGGIWMDQGQPGGPGGPGGDGDAGALYNNGTASLVNCTITGNQGIGGSGGTGGQGGGGNVQWGGQGGMGGNGGNGFGGVDGTCNLTNCTLGFNAGSPGGGGPGGPGGTGTIAGGGQGFPGPNGTAWGATTCAALVNTLIASNSPAGNDSFQDPKLGPLADNGGPTLTMALLSGSPAIDAGDAAAAPMTDQRGFPRPAGAAPDIGAYEYGSVMPTLTISGSLEAGLNIIGGGNTGRVCRLLISADLSQWTSVATNQIGSDGTVLFKENCGAGTCRFYRLAMP